MLNLCDLLIENILRYEIGSSSEQIEWIYYRVIDERIDNVTFNPVGLVLFRSLTKKARAFKLTGLNIFKCAWGHGWKNRWMRKGSELLCVLSINSQPFEMG